MGDLGPIADLIREHTENGRYFPLLSEFKGKVQIYNHDKFVAGWNSNREYAILRYTTFLSSTLRAESEIFEFNSSEDLYAFEMLEAYGVRFRITDHYKKLKNLIHLGCLGS